jgi:hypothetical protein
MTHDEQHQTQRQPTVVVESEDPTVAWAYGHMLSDEGFDVVTCRGPAGRAGSCPALEGRRCPWTAEADVIVFAFDALHPRRRPILEAHRCRPQGAQSICLDAGPLDREALGELAEGTQALDARSTRTEIVAAVRRALGER